MVKQDWKEVMEQKFNSMSGEDLCRFLESRGVKINAFHPGTKGSIDFVDENIGDQCTIKFKLTAQTIHGVELIKQDAFNVYEINMEGAA